VPVVPMVPVPDLVKLPLNVSEFPVAALVPFVLPVLKSSALAVVLVMFTSPDTVTDALEVKLVLSRFNLPVPEMVRLAVEKVLVMALAVAALPTIVPASIVDAPTTAKLPDCVPVVSVNPLAVFWVKVPPTFKVVLTVEAECAISKGDCTKRFPVIPLFPQALANLAVPEPAMVKFA